MPHKLEDLAIYFHTDSGIVCVDVLEVEVKWTKQNRSILKDRLQNCHSNDVGCQKAKVIRAKETDKHVWLVITVDHCATALRELDVVRHAKNWADGIRVDGR